MCSLIFNEISINRTPLGEFQLSEPWSAKILVKLVEEANKWKYIVSIEAPQKKFAKNLYRKPLNVCKDPCRSSGVLT